ERRDAEGGGASAGSVVWGPPTGIPAKPAISTAATSVNWNRSGGSTDTVVRDLTNLGIAGCPANTPGESLGGFNDWANIKLNFRTSVDFADGAHATIESSDPNDPKGRQE